MDSLFQDLRYALRTWMRSPGLALAVVLTLALGIAANVALFSVVHAVLLQPLPYDDPFRLYVIRTVFTEQGRSTPTSSGPEFLDFRDQTSSLSQLGLLWYRPGALTDDAADPEDIDMGFVSAGFLETLGVHPALGRFIQPEEDQENTPSVIVLSHHIWKRRYGADPGIVGKRIELDGVLHTVVGVMPEGFRMFFPPEAGVPSLLDAWASWGGAYDRYPRTWRVFTVIGRLADGISHPQARAELETVAHRLLLEHPEDYEGSGLALDLEPLGRDVVANIRPALTLLTVAMLFVLLIVCANVTHLFLVRSLSRGRETMIRTALGAGGRHHFRQAVTESVLVSFAGAGLGVLFALWGLDSLLLLVPGELPRAAEVSVDGVVLGLTLAVAVATSLLFGTVSILFSRSFSGAVLQSGVRSSGERHAGRSRRILVIGEVALSVVLLVGAGLLLRSFILLAAADPGFDPSRVLTVKLSLVDSDYPYREPEKITRFYRELIQSLSATADIEGVGASSQLPMDGQAYRSAPYAYETPEGVVDWKTVFADYRTVTPGWFDAVGARLIRGRFFEWTDDTQHPNVVVIDEKLADKIWPGQDALGKRLQVEIFLEGEWSPRWAEVTGIVKHIRHRPGRDGLEQIYLPHAQSPQRTMAIAIRSEGEELALIDRVKRAVGMLNADQPIHGVRWMGDYLAESMATTRFTLTTMLLFAFMAVVLALVGIYGVVAYSVSQRAKEIGIRLALGATPARIRGLFLEQGLMLTAAGVIVGLVGAAALARLLGGLLYGVTATDPLTFVAVAIMAATVALVASYLPARRAAKVDPTPALREE